MVVEEALSVVGRGLCDLFTVMLCFLSVRWEYYSFLAPHQFNARQLVMSEQLTSRQKIHNDLQMTGT